MYHGTTFKASDAREGKLKHTGLFPKDIPKRAVEVEIWHSGFNDPDKDFSEFRFVDETGTHCGRIRIEGY